MSTGITYAEIRTWAIWLETFTAQDLADTLGVPLEVGERGVKALLWHGICEDTGDRIRGRAGTEPIIRYIPHVPGSPPRPKHPPPEVVLYFEWGGDPLKMPRGMPVPQGSKRDMSQHGLRRPTRRQGQGKRGQVEGNGRPGKAQPNVISPRGGRRRKKT